MQVESSGSSLEGCRRLIRVRASPSHHVGRGRLRRAQGPTLGTPNRGSSLGSIRAEHRCVLRAARAGATVSGRGFPTRTPCARRGTTTPSGHSAAYPRLAHLVICPISVELDRASREVRSSEDARFPGLCAQGLSTTAPDRFSRGGVETRAETRWRRSARWRP